MFSSRLCLMTSYYKNGLASISLCASTSLAINDDFYEIRFFFDDDIILSEYHFLEKYAYIYILALWKGMRLVRGPWIVVALVWNAGRRYTERYMNSFRILPLRLASKWHHRSDRWPPICWSKQEKPFLWFSKFKKKYMTIFSEKTKRNERFYLPFLLLFWNMCVLRLTSKLLQENSILLESEWQHWTQEYQSNIWVIVAI